MDNKEIQNCPTCGAKVTAKGQTTKYFVPVDYADRNIVVLRQMKDNIWADQNNYFYFRDGENGAFAPMLNAPAQ